MRRSNRRSTTRPKCRRSRAHSRCPDSSNCGFRISNCGFPTGQNGIVWRRGCLQSAIRNRSSAIEMTPAFEKLQKHLKQLPGLGYRSAERIALHLLVEKPARLPELVTALEEAAQSVRRCTHCGNLAESELCSICADPKRDRSVVCVVEHV